MARYIHEKDLAQIFPEDALKKTRSRHAKKHSEREAGVGQGEPVPPADNVTHAHMQLDDGVYAVRASGEIVCVAALCNRKGIRDAIEKGFRVV